MKVGSVIKKHIEELENRDFDACKSDYGKLLIIGGSVGMAGAAYLSGYAAYRAGIGMVRYYGPEENRAILQMLLPEAMYSVSIQPEKSSGVRACLADDIKWADYIICGPGLSRSPQAKCVLKELLSTDLRDKKSVLLDADALNIISEEGYDLGSEGVFFYEKEKTNLIITPHVGEMKRLTGLSIEEIKAKPKTAALDYAVKHHCIVVLKDSVTYVATPGGDVTVIESGSSALSKAGSGDVLTGIITGTVAMLHGNTEDGAVIGTHLHGLSGTLAGEQLGEHCVLARNIVEALPDALDIIGER
ncbi:MAG: NAD(P)H-hydrate dehydratase [Eubacteriales bacterium]|nr:NAD(P)H-hydrate dehydratase [Eubacteriales bacterium]